MKIAQIGPIIERVPPKKYGGTERVIYALTEELVKRGHEVTLFASGDSITSAKLVSVYPQSLREANMPNLYGYNALTMFNIGLAYKMQKEFDIIHDHNGHLSLPAANLSSTPVVITLHGNLTEIDKELFSSLNKPYLVGISESQLRGIENLNTLGFVYNGLDLAPYPFSDSHDGYLLFVGRISEEKGVHFAVEAAHRLSLPLIIAAKLDDGDAPYFEKKVAPGLFGNVKWVGEVDEQERNRLMSRAMCLLHPVTWKEPFGLTMIEAQATGCPVVGFNRGSVPEVVLHGKTGYIAENFDGLLESIKNLDKISRAECRRHVLLNFTAERMTDGYEEIYNKVLRNRNIQTFNE